MKHFYLAFFIFLSISSAFSQGVLFYSPVDQAIGRTGALTSSGWSFFSNPSGIAKSDVASAGVGYYSGFHIKELSSRAAFVNIPTSLVNVSGGFTHYGFEHYSLQQYSLATAKQLAPWMRLGVKFNYLLRHQTGSENFGLTTLDAGVQLEPDPKFAVGFYVVNPARMQWKLHDWNEYHPSAVSAALAYKPTVFLSVELGVVKSNEHPAEVSFAIEAPVHEMVVLRGAMVSKPLRLGFGAGFNWQSIDFNVGFNHHQTLGFSSAFGLLFNIWSISGRRNSQL